MNLIKRKIRIVVLISLILGLSACEEQLIEEPISSYATETFFQTVKQANMAVLGVYNVLGEHTTYGKQLSLIFTLDTDEMNMRGTSIGDEKRQISHYSSNPGGTWIRTTWMELWKGIERANICINKIPEMDLYENGTEDQVKLLKRYLGEAKFLRGMIYFDLVRTWGAVPLKTNPTKAGDDLYLERSSIQEIYNLIDQDMKEAAELVPWLSELSTNEERVSKGAVLGIHARACLMMGGYYLDYQDGQLKRLDTYKSYYQKALDLTKRVMESGEHGLNDSYERVFRNYCENIVDNKESMFEIGLYNPEGNSGNCGIIGTYNSPKVNAKSPYGGASSFVNTTPVVYERFSEDDLRRDVAIATYEVLANGSQKELTGKKEWQWAPGKWRRDWHSAGPKDRNNTDINWVILRYSDVLLMRAEAENEINEGPNDEAYGAINLVRERAGIDHIPTGLDKEEFFEALKNERVLELCFEGWRKLDLYRWNIMGETLRSYEAQCKEMYTKAPVIMGTLFDDNKDELLPIPQREIDENTNFQQNWGY